MLNPIHMMGILTFLFFTLSKRFRDDLLLIEVVQRPKRTLLCGFGFIVSNILAFYNAPMWGEYLTGIGLYLLFVSSIVLLVLPTLKKYIVR